MSKQGYLLEFLPMGPITKVSAIDPASGFEVSIIGSAKASQSELSNLAVQKLKESMEKTRAAGLTDE